MMRFFKTTIFLFFIALGFSGFSQDSRKNKYKNLSPKEFYVFMYADKNSVLIDVSTIEEYEESHIGNSLLAENSKKLFSIIDTVDFEQAIFVYCEYGDRSSQACKLLNNKGFKEVCNLKGGLRAWLKSGYKVDSTKKSIELGF
ncbi:MAG: rhodanese-like domain-containing protein [Bacteroidetes bacterium]|nr:rhodanese-like domain-containing protein [Bacteroidota bacterium]